MSVSIRITNTEEASDSVVEVIVNGNEPVVLGPRGRADFTLQPFDTIVCKRPEDRPVAVEQTTAPVDEDNTVPGEQSPDENPPA